MHTHPHDWVHYFTLFMLFIFIPGGLLAGLLTLLCQGYALHDSLSRKGRVRKLRRHFRRAYRDWKLGETAGEYACYIERQNAEMFDRELTNLGV